MALDGLDGLYGELVTEVHHEGWTSVTSSGRSGQGATGAPAFVPVPADLAPLCARAHHRIRCRPAGVVRADGSVVDQDGRPVGDAPWGPVDRWLEPPDGVAAGLSQARSPLVVVGPGVVLEGAVPGLHALAAAASVGVLNTWGAKGVFDWRSRHHLATVGLQALDLERGAVPEADLVLTSGTDRAELPPTGFGAARVVDVAPGALGPLAEQVDRPRTDIPMPPLRADLARVTQAGWEVDTAPLPPTRVTRHYGVALGGGGLVAADPGLPGYWVARTLPTTGLGGALVPADGTAVGFAVAAAIVARLLDPARPVLAVTGPLAEVHHRLLEVAARLGVPVALEVWDDDGPALDAVAHAGRLERLVARGGVERLATDGRQLAEMEAVAGEVVAWRGAR